MGLVTAFQTGLTKRSPGKVQDNIHRSGAAPLVGFQAIELAMIFRLTNRGGRTIIKNIGSMTAFPLTLRLVKERDRV